MSNHEMNSPFRYADGKFYARKLIHSPQNEYGSELIYVTHYPMSNGGLAIGAERLTMKLLKLSNIREACLFPRDRTRLTP